MRGVLPTSPDIKEIRKKVKMWREPSKEELEEIRKMVREAFPSESEEFVEELTLNLSQVQPTLRKFYIWNEKDKKEGKKVPLGQRELWPNPAQYVVDVLKEHNVECVFGIQGGHFWSVTDLISMYGIKTYVFHHESSAVYAAEAYARVKRKVAVCYVTVGPGTTNFFSGLYQAKLSCTPIVCIVAGNESQSRDMYTIQAHWAETTLSGAAKWVRRMEHPEMIKRLMTWGFRIAQTYPCGPVVLEFPYHLHWSPEYIKGECRLGKHHIEGVFGQHSYYREKWYGDRTDDTPKTWMPGPKPELIKEAVEILWKSERPVITVGDGAYWSACEKELKELADYTHIPVMTRRTGRGMIDELGETPYMSRFISHKSFSRYRGQIDLILNLGVKLSMFDWYGADWPATIQIVPGMDVREGCGHVWTWLDTKVVIISDVQTALQAMLDYIKQKDLKPKKEWIEWGETVMKMEKKFIEDRLKAAEEFKHMSPVAWPYLLACIHKVLLERYNFMNRIVQDGYTISQMAGGYTRARYPGQIIDCAEQAGVGHGVSQAIGAAVANLEFARKYPILVLLGDAGAGLHGMDIETALRYKLPIVYLITNNDGWLMGAKWIYYGKNWDALSYLGHDQDKEFGTSEFLPDLRWDKMFEAIGCHGEWVTKGEEVIPALNRAFDSAEKGIPAVVNVDMWPGWMSPGAQTYAYQMSWGHIPWEACPKKGKALRRWWLAQEFDWEKLGVPMPEAPPDPYYPTTEWEAEP